MLTKEEISEALKKAGIKVIDDKVKKSDVKAFMALSSGFATDHEGFKYYDTKGITAGEKDLQRMRDIKSKSLGSGYKALQLATQMAKSIKDCDKALRRADAASKVFKDELRDDIVNIFLNKAESLT